MSSGLQVQRIKEGNGTDRAVKGDTVTIEYTGYLHDPNAKDNRGTKCDTIYLLLDILLTMIQGSTAPLGEETFPPRLALVASFKVRFVPEKSIRLLTFRRMG